MTDDARSAGGPAREIAIEQGGGKPAIINCPECGSENIQGTDSCVNCGSDLRTLDIPPATWSPGEGPPGERVDRLAHPQPIEVAPDTPVRDVIATLRDESHGCAVVTDGGRVVGIFTERDVLNKVTLDPERLLSAPVSEVMTPNPTTIRPDESVLVALNEMGSNGFRHLPLVDQAGRLTGILSGRDILEYVEQRARPR